MDATIRYEADFLHFEPIELFAFFVGSFVVGLDRLRVARPPSSVPNV